MIALYNDDTLERMKTFPSEAIDMILTDPPFGQHKKGIRYGRSELGHRYIINDDNLRWLAPFAKEAFRVLKDKGWCVVFCQWRTMQKFIDTFIEEGFGLKTVGIWDKVHHGLGAGLAEQYEQILFFRKGKGKEKKFRGNIFRHMRIHGRPEHPHQKPISLLKEIINLLSNENDIIFDGFAGIGSVPQACEELNRNCIAGELDKYYFDIMKKKF